MPNPSLPKPVKISVTSGVKGQPISVINRTTGDVINTTLGATAKAQVDLQNFENGYTDGDVIDFVVSGGQIGINSLTTSGDAGESVTVSTATIATTITRGVR